MDEWAGDASHDENTTRIVQVVAHPDDDLYFLNPDLAGDLSRGASVLSVILTCGETDGINEPDGSPAHKEATADYPGYSGARQTGLMHAYAVMAGLDAHAEWRREAIELVPGRQVELVTLAQRPTVRLAFLNLWQEPRRSPRNCDGRMRQLWQDEVEACYSMVPTGSAVSRDGQYSREELLSALVEVFRRNRPTLVRTMDPDPDYQRHDAENRRHADFGDYSDHQDHTAAAIFTMEALRRYQALPDTVHHSVVAYRGYYNERWPANLTKDAFAAKAAVLAVYGWADNHTCVGAAGGGDRKVGDMAPVTGWGQSQTYRYPAMDTNTHLRADGRLEFYSVSNGRATRWIQSAVGADEWTEGPAVPPCPIAPQLTAVSRPDGRVALFAVRVTLGRLPEDHYREVVHCIQSAPDGEFGPWQDLGTPHAEGNPWRRRGLGLPSVAVRADGSMFVFARNYGGGICGRFYDGAEWSSWLDLGGSDTQEGAACAVHADGRVELVAAHRLGVHRWFQEKPGLEFKREILHTAVPVAPPSLFALGDGRLALLLRRRGDTCILGYYTQPDTHGWEPVHRSMTGLGGLGRVAAAVGGGRLALASHTDSGRVSLALQDATRPDRPVVWQSTNIVAGQFPSVAFDAAGPLSVLIGQDGRPHTERLRTPGPIERLALRERLSAAKRSAGSRARGALQATRSKELGTWHPSADPRQDPKLERRQSSHVQIIAHPDDDLYFMNPDVLHAVRSGDPVATIVLTAGEADGLNAPGTPEGAPDYEGYTAARHIGLRRAYAAMATGDPASPWTVTARTLSTGLTLEESRLNQAPKIRLLFFNLRIQKIEGFGSMARMRSLWNSSIPYMRTLVPTGAPLAGPADVSRGQLLDSLVELLAECVPTVVRTLDPDPECNEFAPAGETSFHDHNDHTQSAYFAIEAVRRYRAGGAHGRIAVESYRGYLNRVRPIGLTEADFALKKSYIDVYGGAGSRDGMLGDRKVGLRTNTSGYGRSTALRYPATAPWTVAANGAGHAFAAVGGDLRYWTRPDSGGSAAWIEQEPIIHGRLDSDLCAARTPDGRVHLVAARLELAERYDSQVRRLDFCSQQEPGGKFGGWMSLGSPHTSDHAIMRRGLGGPVLISDPDGAVHVFVRNFSGGLHHASGRPGAGWEGWWSLGGAGLHGPVAAAVTGSGTLHAIATTDNGFAHWSGTGPKDGYVRLADLTGLPTGPYGAPTVLATADGLLLVTRLAQSGDVLVYRYTEAGGWSAPAAHLSAPGGHGAVAAAWSEREERLFLATRGPAGGMLTAVCRPTRGGDAASWQHSGGLSLRSPALVATGEGVSVLTLGSDAQLYTAQLGGDGKASAWSRAEAHVKEI